MLFLKYLWQDIKLLWRRMTSHSSKFLKPGKNRHLRYKLREKWERLAIRKWVNENPRIIMGISIASVFIFLLIVIAQLMPYRPPILSYTFKAWFYDLNTDKLFVVGSDEIPPIDAPSGPFPDGQLAGVKAYVLSYVREPNESERFIGYLEKYTPQGKEIIYSFRKSQKNVTKESVRRLNQNRFVRRVADNRWFLADSNEGRAILENVLLPNEAGQIPIYYPPR